MQDHPQVPSDSAWQPNEQSAELTDTVVVDTVFNADVIPAPPCHVMLDLETWGTGNKAVIVSIGACKFTADEIVGSFHVGVNPKSCQEFGLEIDADTVLWWMDPGRREALDEWLKLERVDLASALLGFSAWVHDGGVLNIWGNGSTFDNVILRSAFAAAGQEYPVRFWQDACYRTMKQQTAVAIVREGTHHNALDDAISQAKHLQRIWREQDQTELREMLERDRQQFLFYAEQHRAKNTPEADAKAEVNERFAADIQQLLDGGPVQA